MEIEITWFSLLKLFVSGIFTYVLFPLVLVLRDMLLWKVVDIFILNNSLRTRISMYADDIWDLKNKYNKDTFLGSNSDGSDSFAIDNREVTEEEYHEYTNSRSLNEKRAKQLNIFILRRHNLLVWLFKHYKQKDGSNPIPEMQENAYKRVEEREKNIESYI